MEAWASEAGRLEHDSDYEDRVRLDELYMKLERHEDVRRLSALLLEEHPEDARPVLYYAHNIFNTFDLVKAAETIRNAGPEHRDIGLLPVRHWRRLRRRYEFCDSRR